MSGKSTFIVVLCLFDRSGAENVCVMYLTARPSEENKGMVIKLQKYRKGM